MHPVRFVVAVGKATVSVDEVGDVISLVTTATRHNERLARTCYAQLHDALQLLLVVARRAAVRPDRLHGVEPRQRRRLKAGRKSYKNITKQVHYREDRELSKRMITKSINAKAQLAAVTLVASRKDTGKKEGDCWEGHLILIQTHISTHFAIGEECWREVR